MAAATIQSLRNDPHRTPRCDESELMGHLREGRRDRESQTHQVSLLVGALVRGRRRSYSGSRIPGRTRNTSSLADGRCLRRFLAVPGLLTSSPRTVLLCPNTEGVRGGTGGPGLALRRKPDSSLPCEL